MDIGLLTYNLLDIHESDEFKKKIFVKHMLLLCHPSYTLFFVNGKFYGIYNVLLYFILTWNISKVCSSVL